MHKLLFILKSQDPTKHPHYPAGTILHGEKVGGQWVEKEGDENEAPKSQWPTEPTLYHVPLANYARLKEKFGALANKAEKLGLPRPTFEPVGTQHMANVQLHREVETSFGIEVVTENVQRPVQDVMISSPDIAINGWRVIGAIQHEAPAPDGKKVGNIVTPIGEQPEGSLKKYRDADANCEHCKIDRNRTQTYVIENEQGERKQVGSTCLQDFTKVKNAHSLARFAEDLNALLERETDFGGSGQSPYVDLKDLLEKTAWVWKKDGRVYKKTNITDELPTVAQVTSLYLPQEKRPKGLIGFNHKTHIGAEEQEIASKVLAFMHNIPADVPSDYFNNLRVIGAHDIVHEKNFGVATSAIAAWARAEGIKSDKETEMELSHPIEHVWFKQGQDRFEPTPVTYVRTLASFPSSFSRGTVYKMMFETTPDPAMPHQKAPIIVTTEAIDPSDFKEGDPFVMSGNIKEHSEYTPVQRFGQAPQPPRKQTEVSRIKLWTPEEYAESQALVKHIDSRMAEGKERVKAAKKQKLDLPTPADQQLKDYQGLGSTYHQVKYDAKTDTFIGHDPFDSRTKVAAWNPVEFKAFIEKLKFIQDRDRYQAGVDWKP